MASENLKLLIHSSQVSEEKRSTNEEKTDTARKIHLSMSFQDRLLRNSFIACALLLGIMALSGLQQPWAIKASESIEKALTMEIDLDKTLGQLTFVKRLMPESAYVFFNLHSDTDLEKPVQGSVSHAYSEMQPWTMFHTESGSPVCAVKDGIVSAVSEMKGGGYGILIDHGNGMESISICSDDVEVETGTTVVRGGVIGHASGDVYFELRENGDSVDPSERMGL